MTEREKVIDYLEYHIHLLYDVIPHVSRDDGEYLEAAAKTMSDAIILLKAQEPVKPVVDIDTWKCGNCGHTLEHQELLGNSVLFHEQYNFCPECGRAVKYE